MCFIAEYLQEDFNIQKSSVANPESIKAIYFGGIFNLTVQVFILAHSLSHN